MHRATRTFLLAAGVVGAGAAAIATGSRAWERATRRTVRRLLLAGAAEPEGGEGAGAASVADRLAELPEPAARYLRFALPEGAPRMRRARLEHAGHFRPAPGARWSAFRSVQHVTTRPPGFVWDAVIRMVPLVGVRVRDAYVRGAGASRANIAGLFTVAEGHGPAFDAGSLQRWLAEAPWYPAALLPGGAVRWEPVDHTTARAVVTDGDLTVSVEFTVNERGELTRMYTPARMRDVRGTGVPTPWEATFGRWMPAGGVMVPTEGEVAWILPEEGRFAYWRGRIVKVEYA